MVAFPASVSAPVAGATRQVEARVLKATFGDGYAQRAADGINNIGERYEVRWENISRAEANTILDFLAARGGFESFTWTPPGGTTALKWTCETWARQHISAVLDTVTATFVRCFDLN
jgi:phage-related protein